MVDRSSLTDEVEKVRAVVERLTARVKCPPAGGLDLISTVDLLAILTALEAAQARAEKAEASLVELADVTKPFAGVVINSAWTDETPAYGSLTVGHFRRASDVHSRLLEEQLAENAKCSGLSQSQPGVSAVQLPASPSAQHSDGGRDD